MQIDCNIYRFYQLFMKRLSGYFAKIKKTSHVECYTMNRRWMRVVRSIKRRRKKAESCRRAKLITFCKEYPSLLADRSRTKKKLLSKMADNAFLFFFKFFVFRDLFFNSFVYTTMMTMKTTTKMMILIIVNIIIIGLIINIKYRFH